MSKPIHGLHETEYGVEGKMYWKLFDREIEVLINDADEDYAQRCADYLDNLPEELLDRLRRATLLYAQDFYEMTEERELKKFSKMKPKKILNYVRPSLLLIEKPEDDRIAFHIEMNCDWEIEHGLEWSILDGQAMYVGDFEGVSPWNDFMDSDWNYLTKL